MKWLKKNGDPKYRTNRPEYELANPVRGPVTFSAHWVPGSEDYFGHDIRVEAHVVPLENQALSGRPELHADSTVSIGGASAVKRENVLEDNSLPLGKYLFSVKAMGPNNWDRQVIYFEVAAPD